MLNQESVGSVEAVPERVPAIGTRNPKRKIRTEVARRSIWDRVPLPLSLVMMSALVLAGWQAALELELVSEFVVPAPSEVYSALGDILGDLFTGGQVWENFLITAQEVVLGFVLAIALGLSFGVLTAETAFGRRVLQPFIIALYAVPKVALAPILVAWFGFGMTPKVILAAIIAFFPLMIDTAAGLYSVGEDDDKLFRSLRASRWQRFWKLKTRSALPFVFAGLKSAAVLAVIGVLVAEYLGGGKGLGALVDMAATQLALDRVFAYVIVLTVLSYALYLLVDLAERKIVFWRKPEFVHAGS